MSQINLMTSNEDFKRKKDPLVHYKLKILTFNVFIGPPIANIYNNTTSLCNSQRLEQQIIEIKKIEADIICLQEIYCENVLKFYQHAFSNDYHIIYDKRIIYTNQIVGECCILLICYLVYLPIMYLFTILNLQSTLIIQLSSLYIARKYLLSCALFSFLLGNVKGFMITLIKKHIKVIQSETIAFNHQNNDFQNLFRQRCYQRINLEIAGNRISLYNLHLNSIGKTNSKYAQFNQIVDDIKNSNFTDLIICGDFNSELNTFRHKFTDSAIQVGNSFEHTWTDKNPLSMGFLREDNSRVDGILYQFKSPIYLTRYLIEMNQSPFVSDHFGVSVEFIIKSYENSYII